MDPNVKFFIALLKFGSRVYGTVGPDSDEDVIGIQGLAVKEDERQTRRGLLNLHCYDLHEFQELLDEHDVVAVEAFLYGMQNSTQKEVIDFYFSFDLDISKLRSAFSAVASNSWAKAHKKIDQGDHYVGVKSLWHVLRILDFGTQIAKHGTIINWQSCNLLYFEMMEDLGKPWSFFKEKYQPLRNQYQSAFKMVAPK
jgi:predicted nucleotidyltransferase